MDVQAYITRQRVQHIVDSYQLDGSDGDTFADYLTGLLATYPQSLIELALTEAIVKGWSEVPMKKGMSFIQGVHEKLCSWQTDLNIFSHSESIETILTPGQFEQITGLDASLVFDQDGRVLVTGPVGMQKPLEPQS